ncbi:hypothetical protein [Luteolibacter soli]|uniref:Zinc ribbon domain-containing protein n=1 Tax=Luteolibacter soli TaxID=3135280 RepID=A0ABU9AWX0_9BACT
MNGETKPPDDPEAESGKDLCSRCLFPNELEAPFCEKCGAPLTPYASTAPFESVRAEGELYLRAVEQPGSLVVVLGMWIIFAPCLVVGAIISSMPLREDGFSISFIGVFAFLFGSFVLTVSSVVLFKTTRSYLRSRRKNR